MVVIDRLDSPLVLQFFVHYSKLLLRVFSLSRLFAQNLRLFHAVLCDNLHRVTLLFFHLLRLRELSAHDLFFELL